ncbi:MAG: hypothetical protein ACOYXT_14460 [Bacteroidota bacterium]
MNITSYCRIADNTIAHQGKVIFRADQKLDDFLLSAYDVLKPEYPKFYKMDRLSKLGFLAAEVLLRGRAIANEYPSENISLVLSNAHASLDTDLRYAQSMQTLPSPALFVYTLPNIVAGEICIRHRLKGENTFFVSEKFDAELMETHVSAVTLVPCIAGWVDVMDEHHDVFLYLAENKPGAPAHTARQLRELYQQDYGTINGQPEKADY